MPRSGAGARERLQQAALDLYRDRGFDNTTTAQIAARAGVTERTFFRHSSDKREVLIGGEAAVRADFGRGVAEAPSTSDPLGLVLAAVLEAAPLIEGNRPNSRPRNEVITATPAPRERALAKEAALIETLTDAMQQRGVERRRARLAASIGMAAFDDASVEWFDEPGRSFEDLVRRDFENVRAPAGQLVGH